MVSRDLEIAFDTMDFKIFHEVLDLFRNFYGQVINRFDL